MGHLAVVVGGQYGSEGKGAVAAQLSAVAPGRHAAVRVAGPNAGHTVIGPDSADRLDALPGPNREWKLRAVPVAAVSRPDADLIIAAGSEIDPVVLASEIAELDAAGYRVTERLLIDSQATMLEPGHIRQEEANEIQKRLGSTAKGIGAARAERVWRLAGLAKDFYPDTVDTAAHLRGVLANGGSVLIEGTQGYGLGLHAGEYPYCTSSDCRASDFLAMAGLTAWEPNVDSFGVFVVARTRPIRVAGNSGGLKNETSWDELGLKEERTTVTNKVRRVGEWDGDLVRRAIVANGGPSNNVRLVITMVDQVFPETANAQDYEQLIAVPGFVDWAEALEEQLGSEIYAVGVAPDRQVVLQREMPGIDLDYILQAMRGHTVPLEVVEGDGA